jgi:hypothetical protein
VNKPNKQTKLSIVTLPIFYSFLPFLETIISSCSFPSRLLLVVKRQEREGNPTGGKCNKNVMKIMITKSQTLLDLLEELVGDGKSFNS